MATLTFPTTQSLLGQAPRIPLRPTGPAAAPAAAPVTDAEETPEQLAAKRYQAAFRNAMLNPNMPIEQQFSTGSAKADADILRRAQLATAWSNGQAAIQERRNLQAMQASSMPSSGVVSVGGKRVAYKDGVPVGISQDTGVASERVRGQMGPTVLMPEQAEANRREIIRLAGQASAREYAAQALKNAKPSSAQPPTAPTPPVPSDLPPAPTPDRVLAIQRAAGLAPLFGGTPMGTSLSALNAAVNPPPAPTSDIDKRIQEIEAGPTEEQAAATAAKAQRLQALRQQYEQLGRLLQSGQTARPKLQTGQSYTTMGQTVLQPANRDELKRAAAQYRQLRDQIAALSEELGESNP